VLLSRRAGDGEVELGRVGPREVVGAVSVIDGSPAVATATALIRTTVYRMSLEQVMESAGGREQPVSLLLEALAGYVRLAADRLVDAQTKVAERVPQSEVRPMGQP
jgi:CRP-like cAMP-binding protein